MKQQDWIEEVLKSGESLQKVKPSEALLEKLTNISKQSRSKVIPMKTVWMVAAGLALLISLNVFTLQRYNKAQTTYEQTAFESYYDHLNYYNEQI
ncbi:MAG: hypothetical protein ACO2Z9_09060 [Crocinitomicaceae bacterium]